MKTKILITGFLTAGLFANAFGITKKGIDFVVGIDGNFKDAIDAASAAKPTEDNRFVIFFPEGEYDLTNITADRHGKTTLTHSFVSLIGQTRDRVVISNKTDTESIGHTATLAFSKSTGIYMQDLTLQNKSTYCNTGTCRQVALQQNEGDKYIFKNVTLNSGQDTYYTKKGRSYWEGGEIQGTVDFICGGGDVFFEKTNLLIKRQGGYITASQNPGDWGYVFNSTTINAPNGSGISGTFFLGRSWGRAKVVYLNTTMYAEPTAEGWGPDMNSAPVLFGEYNSRNGSGGGIDLSRRKTYFDGGNDKGTATSLNPVLSDAAAAKYTLEAVLAGQDSWAPNTLTQQVEAPEIAQEGAFIKWQDNVNARYWAVFVNGKYHSNTTVPNIDVGNIPEGAKVTVRAANSMGGLGNSSNEISVTEANVTYHKVSTLPALGGSVETAPNKNQIAEGSEVTFTAVPAEGWTFVKWTGKNAENAGSEAEWKTIITDDIELGAEFEAKGTTIFQAESGIIENALFENEHKGFGGSGYINFLTGVSYIKVPVYIEYEGEYTIKITYANGSKEDRDLLIMSEDSTKQQITFAKTEAWDIFNSLETTIKLPAGASYITFSIVDGNDGPNLDQIELTPNFTIEKPDEEQPTEKPSTEDNTNEDIPSKENQAINRLVYSKPNFNGIVHSRLYSTSGKFIRESFGETIDLRGLKSGVYLLQETTSTSRQQRIIQVH